MRFVAHGPSIPDELLEQRDRGNVVFFCGAGVSMPAGWPNFPKLTQRVMQVFGTSPDAPSRRLFEQSGEVNLDQVFNRLNEEYSRDEVERTVSRILATPRKTKSGAVPTRKSIWSRISTSQHDLSVVCAVIRSARQHATCSRPSSLPCSRE
jgi:hypothetical protein